MRIRDRIAATRSEIRSAYKSQETEEKFDLVFTKPLGYLWAKLFMKLDWTPNAVTILSMAIGFTGGWLMLPENFWWNLAGVLLVIWADVLDSTDGQMARLQHRCSTIGRILDGLSSYVWYIGIYLALAIRLTDDAIYLLPGRTWGGFIWIVVVISGLLGHGLQSLLADYYRNIHLFFLKNRNGSELTTAAEVKRQRNAIPKGTKKIERTFLGFYFLYTRLQELLTPRMQHLLACINEKFDGAAPTAMKETFLSESRRLIPLTNILTFNARAYTLFALLLLNVPVLYFPIEIFVFGAMLIFMRRRYENLASELTQQYENE